MTKKLITAAIIASIATATFAPATFASTDVTITDNGAKSDNIVVTATNNTTVVEQSNNTAVVTLVEAKSNTGENSAKYNTGGDTKIKTGDATTNVAVTVAGSSNTAKVENCNCQEDTTVKVKNNGAKSDNIVKVFSNAFTGIFQTNNSFVLTGVEAKTNIGDNKIKANTNGNTKVKTGASQTNVLVEVTGAKNKVK